MKRSVIIALSIVLCSVAPTQLHANPFSTLKKIARSHAGKKAAEESAKLAAKKAAEEAAKKKTPGKSKNRYRKNRSHR